MLRVTLSLAETDAHRGRVLASHTTTVPVVHVTVLEVARGPSSRQGAWDSCAASVEGPRLHVPRPCAWFPSGRACADRGGRPAACRSPTLFSTRGPAWSRPGWAIPATHSHRSPSWGSARGFLPLGLGRCRAPPRVWPPRTGPHWSATGAWGCPAQAGPRWLLKNDCRTVLGSH